MHSAAGTGHRLLMSAAPLLLKEEVSCECRSLEVTDAPSITSKIVNMRGFTTGCPQISVQDNVMYVDGKLINPGGSQKDTML
jgi:hypothetical protein